MKELTLNELRTEKKLLEQKLMASITLQCEDFEKKTGFSVQNVLTYFDTDEQNFANLSALTVELGEI